VAVHGSNRKNLFGMPLDIHTTPTQTVERLAAGPLTLSYLNPYAWKVAKSDPAYPGNLAAMDLVVCDGIAVQAAVSSVFDIKTPIVSMDFSGIGRSVFEEWARTGAPVCLVGGTAEVIEAARRRIEREFPGINVQGYFNGFGESVVAAREFILARQPEAVMVAMGMGLQEAFIQSLRSEGWNGTGICVGAFFDRLAKPSLEYPGWSTKYNVRFLGNLGRRPGYYLRRYAIDYLPFLKHYAGHVLSRKKT
jgi:N-acetylglucosaminyldiphosphoundecaprenol N-acetyl-beta-D-mannosaminyltransferase